jgi:limonene-1,2-epoxide hydrolase/ferredoxin
VTRVLRLVIDADRCTGNGRCYTLFPDLFVDDDRGHASVVGDGTLPDARLDDAQRAVIACPEDAIRVEDVSLLSAAQAVIRRAYELWGTGDGAALAALFADDAVYDNVPAKQPLEGRDAIRAWLEMVFEHLVVDVEVAHMVSAGDVVLSERLDTHIVGEHRIPLPVMNSSRVIDGKIVLWRDYYDEKMFLDQHMALGLG